MNMRFVLKNDRFRKRRGGYSRLLQLNCEKCKNPIFNYQKDGPGILKRLYLDRIVSSKSLEGKNLSCSKCGTVLGVRIVYEKEKRLAFRLFAGAVSKKIIKK